MPKNRLASLRPKGGFLLMQFAAFIIVIAGLKAADTIVVRFLLSAFIAIICAPPFFWLHKKGLPKVVSLLIVVFGILIIGFILVALIGTSLADFTNALPRYQERLPEYTTGFLDWFAAKGIIIPDEALFDVLNPGYIIRMLTGMLTSLGGALSDTFFILLTIIFILLEASSFPAKLKLIWGDSPESGARLHEFVHNTQKYLAIKTIISLGTGIIVAVFMLILNINYALLLGLIAFLLNYVPTIGSIIAAIPAIIIALVMNGGDQDAFIKALLVALVYLSTNVTFGNFIEPRYMGKGLGISILVVFLSVVFWGWVFGPIGMLLSVPLTMTLKIALDSSENTRWLAILLGPELPIKQTEKTKPEEK